ncbi:MAG: hypothetical protein WCS37_21615, partial [Chloroflexota bacterium]
LLKVGLALATKELATMAEHLEEMTGYQPRGNGRTFRASTSKETAMPVKVIIKETGEEVDFNATLKALADSDGSEFGLGGTQYADEYERTAASFAKNFFASQGMR